MVDGLAIDFFQTAIFGAEEELRISVIDRVVVNVGAIHQPDSGHAVGDGLSVAADDFVAGDGMAAFSLPTGNTMLVDGWIIRTNEKQANEEARYEGFFNILKLVGCGENSLKH